MKVYTFDIDWHDNIEITNIRRQHKTDLCGYSMEDFHCGMADLEYDFFVSSNFGKEGE